jgi:hypothetical protein
MEELAQWLKNRDREGVMDVPITRIMFVKIK